MVKINKDLSILPIWPNLSNDSHNLSVIAKANNFLDSNPTTVTFSKIQFDVLNPANGTTKIVDGSDTYQYQLTAPADSAKVEPEFFWMSDGAHDARASFSIDNQGLLTCEHSGGGGGTGNASGIATITFTKGNIVITDTIGYNVSGAVPCLAKGTLITLANGKQKNIEDINYNDSLLTWDFDNGCYSSAKPIWIAKPGRTTQYNLLEFNDGSTLKTINRHRVFDLTTSTFAHSMNFGGDQELNVSDAVFSLKNANCQLSNKKIVNQPIEYYNLITDHDLNCFANNILTSCRLNNMYPIINKKYQKSSLNNIPYEEYQNVTYEQYQGLRLQEQPTIYQDYIDRLNQNQLINA